MNVPFVPPPYPYDRLRAITELAERHHGVAVDLSVGTPCDPPPAGVTAMLAASGSERGYPTSIGSLTAREAVAGWFDRRLGVDVDPATGAALCVGTKEFVASLPMVLKLRRPDRDTVLYPAISYPTYAMGATLAGCRAVPVAVDDQFRIQLDSIDPGDAQRALCLWVNTPGNPAGGLDDLVAAADWGRQHDVVVASDECYVEFTWTGPPVGEVQRPARTILAAGNDGVLSVQSLSKRSNLAGLRAGFYAGDAELVRYLSEVRKHQGLMVPGPIQAAMAVALDDDAHVVEQRARYWHRLISAVEAINAAGIAAAAPEGAFYLWVAAPDGDAWAFARWLAEKAGIVVSPGEFYGPSGAHHVRMALVQPDNVLSVAFDRLTTASSTGPFTTAAIIATAEPQL